MALTSWLIDKSAYARLGVSVDADEWVGRINRGLVRISTVTRLELGYSARSGHDLSAEKANPPLSQMPLELMTPAIEHRAIEVQQLLADSGLHRGPSIPDLLVAAVAEKAGLTVLHVDSDFDRIAALTRQTTQRLE